jgi:hypothetical protein
MALEICSTAVPELKQTQSGHFVSCHLYNS